jgi:signal transduction histidine kinase
MVLYAENLEKVYKVDPDKIEPHIRNICSNAKKLGSYINATRHCLSNSERNCFFKISDVINDSLKILGPRIENENIEIDFCSDDIQIYNNPLALYRVIINLISNAIDAFDGTNEIVKKIKLEVNERGNTINIKISDNGCGIPARMQREIFVLGISTKGAKGSGYGLSLTKDIIENRYKGEISLQSRIDHGTTVGISFPKKFNQKSLFNV